MSKLLLFPLSLLGAMIVGLPGAFLVFAATAGTGSEVVCCMANVPLGVAGAFMGMRVAVAIGGDGRIRVVDVVVPGVLGVVGGVLSYVWLCWAISYADPPV